MGGVDLTGILYALAATSEYHGTREYHDFPNSR